MWGAGECTSSWTQTQPCSEERYVIHTGLRLGGRFAFILLLINVLRCYIRKGVLHSLPSVSPTGPGGFSGEQLRQMSVPGAWQGCMAVRRWLFHHTVIALQKTARAAQLQRCQRHRADQGGRAPGRPLLSLAASLRCLW